MLNHVVLMKFKAGVSRAEVDELEKNMDALQNTIVEIQMYEIGRDVILSDRYYEFAIVALYANT